MWQAILKFVIVEVVRTVLDIVRDAVALKKKQKEDQILVKDALSEKDPKERAKRVKSLLNG